MSSYSINCNFIIIKYYYKTLTDKESTIVGLEEDRKCSLDIFIICYQH